MLADFLARTAVWVALLAVWASLHKPQDAGWLPRWAGMPTLVGGALVVTGVGLYVAGAVALARTKRDAVGTPNQLVVEGPYRYVRNPVYLAMVIIIVGLSLLYQAWQVSDIVRTGFLLAPGISRWCSLKNRRRASDSARPTRTTAVVSPGGCRDFDHGEPFGVRPGF